jgi:hypothetical protein
MTIFEENTLQDGTLMTQFRVSNSTATEPRVWCAMIYVADSRDVAGAVRRSKRLHSKQAGARREVERWVTEMARPGSVGNRRRRDPHRPHPWSFRGGFEPLAPQRGARLGA